MKVGTYDIPDHRLEPTLIDATKKIYEKFRSDEADKESVAQLLGHKSASGAFAQKLSNMRAYGLITKRGIKVTELGKKITYGDTEEIRNNALKEAILNIPLWSEIYSKHGVDLPKEDFWVDLRTITGLEAPDAQKLEDDVRKAYIQDTRNIVEETKTVGDEDMEKKGHEEVSEVPNAIVVKAGQYHQTLPYNEKGVNLAQSFLEMLKNQMKEEQNNKESSEEV